MESEIFVTKTKAAVAATPIYNLLSTTHAVVLERIAMTAGNTRWYYCSNQARIESVVDQLSPGSVVSFYFDQRIECTFYSPVVKSRVERIMLETGEAIIGLLRQDDLHIDVEVITGHDELISFESRIVSNSRVFFGVFPARDNDGIRAVTITLPDIDGIIRAHPH
jgi:hypothetical protein